MFLYNLSVLYYGQCTFKRAKVFNRPFPLLTLLRRISFVTVFLTVLRNRLPCPSAPDPERCARGTGETDSSHSKPPAASTSLPAAHCWYQRPPGRGRGLHWERRRHPGRGCICSGRPGSPDRRSTKTTEPSREAWRVAPALDRIFRPGLVQSFICTWNYRRKNVFASVPIININ